MTFGFDVWALARRLWVIVMRHPADRASTLLQAEDAGATYVLAYTSRDKASQAIDTLGVAERAHTSELSSALTSSQSSEAALEFVSAICRVGAAGVMVDFEPGERRCAFLRRLVANA